MSRCSRCGGQLNSTDPRGVIDGKVYHLYCWYKITEKQKEDKKEKENKQNNNT